MAAPIRKAVFPVAGLGTRFLPATKAMPKEMLPVVDRPLIQYALEEAQAAGIEEFIFVTSRGKSALEDHFDTAYELQDALRRKNKSAELDAITAWLPSEGRIAYTRQREPLGLGHAVWCARRLVGDEPFAVMLPDDLVLADKPCIGQMIQAFAETGGNLVGVMEVPAEHTRRYGVLDTGREEGRLVEVKGLVEKPEPEAAPSRLAVIGRYILLPELFRHLDRQERGAGNEIQLTDAMARMIGSAPFHGFRYDGRRYDCGDKIGLLEANLAYALARDDTRKQAQALIRAFAS